MAPYLAGIYHDAELEFGLILSGLRFRADPAAGSPPS